MKCPKCQAEMEAVTFEAEKINRCVKCKGLWFDEFELSDLKELEGSESIDTGDAKKGAAGNKIDRIACPKCGDPMMRMVDIKQPHIWYETCDVCGGSFLDAGEFRDLKTINLVDKLRDFYAKAKGGRGPKARKLSAGALQKILK